jgi:predicted DNA repair protein MutK
MAGSSLLLLLDDIAAVLDDVAAMAKIAAKKTTGVLGDDLALNAEQVAGVRAERELPVVWAVAKGSLRNKLILVPAALAISWFVPWLITPLLMLGGLYLCLEGFEKIAHPLLHGHDASETEQATLKAALHDPNLSMLDFEQQKIRGAIRTDFVLSAEIIVITLGSVAAATFLQKVIVVSSIAVVMTIGVYGLVACIVKLDDVGLYLSQRVGNAWYIQPAHRIGRVFLLGAPYLMKALALVGTVAMFMVGGGILSHGIAPLHHAIEHLALAAGTVPGVGQLLALLAASLLDALAGVVAGALALAGVTLASKVYQRLRGGTQ